MDEAPSSTDRAPVHRRRLRAAGAVAAVLVLGAAGLWFQYDGKLDLGGDNVTYLLLGRALARGDGYVESQTPGSPPHRTYPPGYPLLLSLAFRVVPWSAWSHVTASNVLSGALFLASLAAALALFARLCGDTRLALTAALLLTVNAHLLRFGSIAMSEMPYTLLSLGALLAVDRSRLDRAPWRDWRTVTCAVLAAASVYVRTAGVAVAAGAVLYLLWRRAWRHAAFTACTAAALVLPWAIRGTQAGGDGYLSQLLMVNPYQLDQGLAGPAALAARLAVNAWSYASAEIPEGLFPLFGELSSRLPVLGPVAGCLLTGVAVWGVVAGWARTAAPAFYAAAAMGVLLLWPPVWTGVRFVVPLVPLLVFFFVSGLWDIAGRAIPALRRGRLTPLVLLAAAVFSVPGLLRAHGTARLAYYPAAWDSYLRTAVWARTSTPPGTVFSCRKPSIFAFFSERRTTAYLFSGDSERLVDDLLERGADCVVVDQLGYASTERFLVPALRQYPAFFEEAHHELGADTYVFRLVGAHDQTARRRLAGLSWGIRACEESQAGNHAAALDHYRQAALILMREVPQPDSLTALTAANVGAGFLFADRADSALRWLDTARASFGRLGMDTTPAVLALLCNTANACLRTGDTLRAVAEFGRVLQTVARHPAPGDPNAVLVLQALAVIHTRQNRPAEAERCRRRLLDRLSAPETPLPQMGQVAYDMAAWYAQHGRRADAQRVLQRLADACTARLASGDPLRQRILGDTARFAAELGVAPPRTGG